MARLSLAVAVAIVLALASGRAASQAPAPEADDCSSAVSGLISCLPYVQGSTQGSTQGKPAAECCAGVKAAVQSPATVACLCAAFGQAQGLGVPVNLTRAAGLPAECGEDPAAFSLCNIQVPGAPGSAPAAPSPGSSKSAAVIRSPASALAIITVVVTLLSHCLL